MHPNPLAAALYGINATRGIIGISPKLQVYSGYERAEHSADNEPPQHVIEDGGMADWLDEQYAPEERRALADEMLRRWTEYRDAIKTLDPPAKT